MKILLIFLTLLSFNLYASPVDINKADAKTIAQSLNGIGIKKAEAIIEYRNANGPFASLKELTSVKGIGDKTIKKNKKDIHFSKVKSNKKSKKKKSSK